MRSDRLGSVFSFDSSSPLLLLLLLLLLLPSPNSTAQPFYENHGVAGEAQKLNRAGSGIRVLHVAAHPDDEDSGFLAYMSLGAGVRTTYLSLTRGEGGQNLIGPELFDDLGIIRTSELLAARREDGATQLFGRMIDFGFSKTADEALSIWGRENVVADIVRAIRMTRPHIVYSRFQGKPSDGHGQHQAAGIGTREAIEAAADPNRFPEQIKEGLMPWRVQKFYVGSFDKSAATTLEISTSEFDPWIGRSYSAVGAKGRSQHRSQDMGMPEFESWRPSFFIREFPKPDPAAPEKNLFDGIKIEKPVVEPAPGDILKRAGALVDPRVMAPDIAAVLQQWRAREPKDEDSLRDLQSALANVLGVRLEAFADAAAVAIGSESKVNCTAYFPEESEIKDGRWTIAADPGIAVKGGEDKGKNAAFTLAVGTGVPPSLPYFLRKPRANWLYTWPDAKSAELPFEKPVAVATFQASYRGTEFKLEVPVENRRADRAFGEIRSDLAIVPPVSVEFEPMTYEVRAGNAGKPVEISLALENFTSAEFADTLTIHEASSPDKAAAELKVKLAPGAHERYPIHLSMPATGGKRLEFIAEWSAGQGATKSAYRVTRLDYRHIRPRIYSRPSELRVDLLDVNLPPRLQVGYVDGSGDGVAEVLKQLGADVRHLDSAALATGDLSKFDAIVLGVRAYEVRKDLVQNNARLLDYARGGGTLIVQYNKPGYGAGALAPYPFSMARLGDRVTDEHAAVTLLEPKHSLFHFPNEIKPQDFEGWIQERGLYFWTEWDKSYTPLMSCADPGEDQKRGGMLYAKLGKGNYVYTGYAFFRQLPGGVEGATKLFANLISLGRAGASR